ncbi:MAG: hypothetical protein GF388_00400 [Candidatus Aegiribacteria sp.]|nr:hypothetical protein [Candidatus Aegiribacteria sp.]
MTGLAAHSDYLYVSSDAQNRVYRYSLPSIFGRQAATPLGRGSETGDIARDPMGNIWVADSNTQTPVRCSNMIGDTLAVIGSDVLDSAAGLALDDRGRLWISGEEGGTIYGVDISEILAGGDDR